MFVSEFCLEALGLPKLNIYVNVLCRLPNCVFSAPNIVFRAAGHALADSLCHRPWQIAYFQYFCPPPKKMCLEELVLPKLSILVIVLGRLPISVFSALDIVLRGAGLD